MRIGELAGRTGVPVPTIKYYLREGLLPAGTATAANQADYGEDHVRRLRLIRALIEVGGVPVAGTRAVLAALDDPSVPGHDLLGAAHHAVLPARTPDRTTPVWRAARKRAATIVANRDWLVDPDAPALDLLADTLAALGDLGADSLIDRLGNYADAAATVAGFEVDAVATRPDRATMLELVVIGTVLGGALFDALRLLAHEDASARRFLPAAGSTPGIPRPDQHG